MAIINGRQYEFADLTLILGGRDVTGFRGIKYTEKQEKEVLYGKGNKPMSIQKGNFSYEGEISLTQSELETLKALARTKTLRSSIMGLTLNAVAAAIIPVVVAVAATMAVAVRADTKKHKNGTTVSFFLQTNHIGL